MKKIWLNNKCVEIEQLEKENDNFNLHKQVKETAELYKQRVSLNLVDENGLWITDKQYHISTQQRLMIMLQ